MGIIQDREFAEGNAEFMFVTDSGGYFDESVNAGSEPPIPFQVIGDAIAKTKGDSNRTSISLSENHVLTLSKFTELETLESGGIYSCVSVPRSWFDEQQRDQMFAAATPAGVLAVVFLLSGLGRYHTTRVLKEAESKIVIAERLELALTGSQDAIFDWDLEQDTIYFAPKWADLLRCDVEDIGDSFETILNRVASRDFHQVESGMSSFIKEGADSIEMEFRLMANDGSVHWVLLRAAANRTDRVANRIFGSVADITSLKAVEEKMRQMLHHDQLTGLASRSKFIEELGYAYTRSHHSDAQCAVLFLDFDRFKLVNDTLGHNIGDELLKSIAQRLESFTESSDTVARFGGDEFVILLNKIDENRNAGAVAGDILRACAEPHVIHGHRLISTASIGLICSNRSCDGPNGMLRDADAAMYQAKSNGRGCVVEFDEAMYRATLKRFELEEDLRDAVEDNQFSLFYQPIMDLEFGNPIGAEALIRWNHPERGMISPADFIPIAEETNQIYSLGGWVIHEACRQVSEWKRAGVIHGDFRVSINLSKIQLATPGFVEDLCSAVSQANLQPSELKLEVTETTIVDNRSDIASVLKTLQSLGFVIMMDDFGTGHSSLSGLHALPIDELKIDQSFIHAKNADRNLIAITSSIVNLAKNLNLRTVGEGIETADDATLLKDLGCMYGQGYYFARPLQANDFVDWLSQRSLKKAA
ncbi:MAG: putative bifunctional diguanylate cyclase/phosphodiesterase [Phycisphaerales bacterium]